MLKPPGPRSEARMAALKPRELRRVLFAEATMWNRSSCATAFFLAITTGCHMASPAPARPLDPPAAANDLSNTKENSPVPSRTYTKPSLSELKQRLTPIEFQVTQNDATEPPFRNDFWDNHAPGIYVDIATGEPLFSSLDKFESGTGWPSFTRPIEDGHVLSKSDGTLGMERTEVRSSGGDSH